MHSRMLYCSSVCRHKKQWQNQKIAQYKEYKSANIKPEPYQPKVKQVLITDEEQKKIDHECFMKTAVTFDKKIYKKNSKEWKEIVKTLTPLNKIKKTSENQIRRINVLW